MKITNAVRLFTFLGIVTSAQGTNLVLNGSFEQTTLTNSGQFTTTNVLNWSTNSYTFLAFPGTGTTNIGNGVALYPGTAPNTLPATSPDGGNYVAADGSYFPGPISQTINNLVVGSGYTLTFYQAAAQQQGFTGDHGDNFAVTLGAQTQLSEVMNNPSQSFTPWKKETLTFTATATQELLSFLAQGTPTGGPPFTLLDGVSLTQTPEPGSVWLIGGAMLALSAGAQKLRNRKKE